MPFRLAPRALRSAVSMQLEDDENAEDASAAEEQTFQKEFTI